MKLGGDVYKLCKTFPKCELFGLCSQMQRAAVSIPSNIAEGAARNSTKEYIHFLSISTGSASELETQLGITEILGYHKDENTLKQLNHDIDIIRYMLIKLMRSLQQKL